MTIEIVWNDPAYISAGTQRDKLRATIKDPSYFFSGESFKTIPKETSDEIKVPLSMPNNEFTIGFIGFSNGAIGFSNASLVGNFLFNLLLSGTMNLLWGLLHSM